MSNGFWGSSQAPRALVRGHDRGHRPDRRSLPPTLDLSGDITFESTPDPSASSMTIALNGAGGLLLTKASREATVLPDGKKRRGRGSRCGRDHD
jgi:hypothetical protein